MTKIVIKKTRHGEYLGFTCMGHAGHAEAAKTDRDVVCAAISVLVINTLNALDAFTDVRMQVESDEAEGLVQCQFEGLLEEKAEVLMDAMVLGLKDISKEYGTRFCKLKFEEV